QLGHLVRITEDVIRQGFTPGLSFAFPPKTANDAKAPPTSDDPAAFATKAELLAGWEALVDALIAGVRGKSDEELSKPSPEAYRGWAPTLGELALAQAFHMVMHVGQIQSIRRKLGKKVLF
ncbi:DinB family protein, partial [bacterium]